ncbi:hypothetical protein TNCV_54921 [Trichonephila clavipes]|nr:hypothetical protein TNCV_54921 [Trichonephila clavipes]
MEYFVWAGVVVLDDGGHVLVLRSCAKKNVGGMREVVILGDRGPVLISSPAPQTNVGGMREGRWEIKSIKHLFSIEYFVWARVVVHGDGRHVLVLRSCASKECGWNAEGSKRMWVVCGRVGGNKNRFNICITFVTSRSCRSLVNRGHVLVLRPCVSKIMVECGG